MMRHLGVHPLSATGQASALLPGEALRRLCRGDRPFLLDGAADADGLGRFSYGGCDPVTRHVDRQLDPPPAGGRGGSPGFAGRGGRSVAETPLMTGRAQALPLRRLDAALAGWGP